MSTSRGFHRWEFNYAIKGEWLSFYITDEVMSDPESTVKVIDKVMEMAISITKRKYA